MGCILQKYPSHSRQKHTQTPVSIEHIQGQKSFQAPYLRVDCVDGILVIINFARQLNVPVVFCGVYGLGTGKRSTDPSRNSFGVKAALPLGGSAAHARRACIFP